MTLLRSEHDKKFHMVAVVSNSVQYKSRYSLYGQFAEDFKKHSGATLWTIELSHGARNHAVTESHNPNHIQVWTSALPGELWYKENLINLAVSKIIQKKPDARYIGWSDADFLFEPDAIDKTIQALQTWDVVQMWSHLINLDPEGHIHGPVAKSFMYCHYTGDAPGPARCHNYDYVTPIGAPGGAWAFRREMLNQMGCAISGPILDFGIVGSGDHYFANAIVGDIQRTTNPAFHPNYKKWLKLYQDNSDRVLKRNVGYVANTVRHLWHGSKSERGYGWRSNILIDCQFDPETDLTKDVSGLWRLVVTNPRQIKMRDDLRKYFRSRKEDATTVT